VPVVHVAPLAQTLLHVPQSEGSVCKSTQAPLQSVRPVAHVVVHCPAEHTCPVAHWLPQAPQLPGSLCVSVHTPLQRWPLL